MGDGILTCFEIKPHYQMPLGAVHAPLHADLWPLIALLPKVLSTNSPNASWVTVR